VSDLVALLAANGCFFLAGVAFGHWRWRERAR
jgi:hypothetical protein